MPFIRIFSTRKGAIRRIHWGFHVENPKMEKLTAHAEKYRPGSQFSLIFRFFLVGPHQNESRNRRHEIDAAEEAHGKRFLHILQSAESEHVPAESSDPRFGTISTRRGSGHHNRISDQVADLLLLQKDQRQKIPGPHGT